MVEAREIKIFSTVGKKVILNTNVETLGELKPLLSAEDIDYSRLQLVVGETKNALELDEAILPTGPFKIYLMPKETKSGSNARLIALFEKLSEVYSDIASEFENAGDSSEGIIYNETTSFVDSEDQAALREMEELQGKY